MKIEKIKEAAELLYRASVEAKPIQEALTQLYTEITIEDAYKIQLENVMKKVGEGKVVVGKKIGLTSRAMQNMLGVPEPDYGHLFDDMVGEEELPIKLSNLLQSYLYVYSRQLLTCLVPFMPIIEAP